MSYNPFFTGGRRKQIPPVGLPSVPNSANLIYWFAADFDVYTDAAGTTPASDTDLVYTWRNQGTESSDGVQATSGSRPVYRTGGQNGKPYLDFSSSKFFDDLNGGNQPSGITNFTPWTCFAVIENTPTAADAYLIGASEVASTGPSVGSFYLRNSGANFAYAKDNATLALPNGAAGVNVIGGGFRNSVTALDFQDGTHSGAFQNRTHSFNASGTATNGMRFGRHGSTPGAYFNGRLYEVLYYYDTTVNTSQGQEVLDYLTDKYNVS